MKLFILVTVAFMTSSLVYASNCGQSGTLNQRIYDCNYSYDGFKLVQKKADDKIYLDTENDILWGPRLDERMGFEEAKAICKNYRKNKGIRVAGYSWRLPKAIEYRRAYKDGLNEALNLGETDLWASRGGRYWMHEAYAYAANLDGHLMPSYTGWIRNDEDNDGYWDGEKYMQRNVRCVGVRD